jgi:cyd operon protein YbgT
VRLFGEHGALARMTVPHDGNAPSFAPAKADGAQAPRLLHGAAFFFMIVAKAAAPAAGRRRLPACRSIRVAGRTIKETVMWYFTWILGVGVALGFGIINVMWLETNGKFARDPRPDAAAAPREDKPA